jgi:hypothetical protein
VGCATKPGLDIQIQGMANKCVCTSERCDCKEDYSSDMYFIDCSGKTVNSVVDIIKSCNYGYRIGEEDWEHFPAVKNEATNSS